MQKFHGHIVYLTILASELTIFVLSGHIRKKKNAFLCLFLKVFGENIPEYQRAKLEFETHRQLLRYHLYYIRYYK